MRRLAAEAADVRLGRRPAAPAAPARRRARSARCGTARTSPVLLERRAIDRRRCRRRDTPSASLRDPRRSHTGSRSSFHAHLGATSPARAAAPSAPDTAASSPCSTGSRPDPQSPGTSARGIPSTRSPCAALRAAAPSRARRRAPGPCARRGPRSTPTARRPPPAPSDRRPRAPAPPASRRSRRTQSRHRFSAMRYSHDENFAWPRKPGSARNARRNVSWHTSRASSSRPIVRYARA